MPHRVTPKISLGFHGNCEREQHTIPKPYYSVENLFPDGFHTTVPVSVVVISSDGEPDCYECRKQSKEGVQHIFPMQSTGNVEKGTESDFLSIDLDRESHSSGNSTCSEYVQPQEDTDTELE